MACEVNNKEINSQCAELLVRPTYLLKGLTEHVFLIVSVQNFWYDPRTYSKG